MRRPPEHLTSRYTERANSSSPGAYLLDLILRCKDQESPQVQSDKEDMVC